ncbi:unnamed protein product [Arabis nemorensis]|uniref:Legume lectin domain-containing protein n=1 Tax=Arabis nemorensis TaxID=586526 RepID=A0A565C190_9BRAS|nr:unnamed protein product [Arabis nemorensis]
MSPYRNILHGHGFAFVFLLSLATSTADSAQHLGIFNFTNNGDPNNPIFGVEFDVFANQEFNDINDNHVGVDVNSLTSVSSAVAEFYDGQRFTELRLNSGDNYQAWIEFNGSAINVTIARASSMKPVYRGELEGKQVAVKRIMVSPRESVAGTSEFLAEVGARKEERA